MEQSAYCGNNVWCFGPQSRQTDVLHKAAEQAATGCTVYCPVPEADIKRNGDLLTQLAQQVDIAFVGDHFWDASVSLASINTVTGEQSTQNYVVLKMTPPPEPEPQPDAPLQLSENMRGGSLSSLD